MISDLENDNEIEIEGRFKYEDLEGLNIKNNELRKKLKA